MRSALRMGTFLAAAIMTGSAAMAQDLDLMCLTMRAAAGQGAAAAEQAALEAALQNRPLTPAQLQSVCRAIACGLDEAPPEVADAILSGVIRAGNDELAACVANFTTLQPAAIVPPPTIDGSPG